MKKENNVRADDSVCPLQNNPIKDYSLPCKLHPEAVTHSYRTASGITLIALVITIIVLLILAGVSINLIAGSNGILSKAQNAVTQTSLAQIKEEIELKIVEMQMDYYSDSSLQLAYTSANEYAKAEMQKGITLSNGVQITCDTEGNLLLDGGEIIGTLNSDGTVSINGTSSGIITPTKKNNTWTQNGTSVSNGTVTLEVGIQVSGYEANGVSDWYVLGAENGKLLITTNSNVTTVTLEGQDGYVNGIATLNAEAEKYTNATYAEGKARSINVDDINRVTGYDPDVAQWNSGDNIMQWKNEVTYTNKDGKIYSQGNKYPTSETLSPYTSFTYWTGTEWKTLAAGESATLTCTRYVYYPQTLTDDDSKKSETSVNGSSAAYSLLFANTEEYYWLGSQYIATYEGNVDHCLCFVHNGFLDGGNMVSSSGTSIRIRSYGLRPVVSLKSSVQVGSDGALSL